MWSVINTLASTPEAPTVSFVVMVWTGLKLSLSTPTVSHASC